MTHPDPWQQQQHSNDLDPFMPFNCNQIDLHLPPPHREPSPFDLHLPPPHSPFVKELSPEYRIQPIDNSDKEPSMPSMECPRPSMPFCIEIDLEEDDVPSQTAPILCCSEFIIMLLRVHLYRLGMIIFIIGCLCIRTIHSQVMDLDNQFTCYLYASHSHTHPLNAGSIFGEYAWCESIGMQLDITYRADNASKANTETNETIPTLYLYMYPLCYMHLLSIEHVESLFISRYGDLICNLALQAVMIVREPNQEIREMEAKSEQKDAFAQVKHIVIDTKRFARVERIPGGQMEDSYVLDDITNPRIICLDIPMEYNKGESQTNIEITKEVDFEKSLQIEEDYIKKFCDKLISLKPDVVVTEKGCSDLAQHYLQRAGVTVLRRMRKTDNTRLARCSGATIGHRIDLLTEKDVGTKCGGATEMTVTVKLNELADKIDGVMAYPYRAVAEALEIIPRTLIQNCGKQPIKVLTELRAKHATKEGMHFGVDGKNGDIVDMNKYGIWEPFVVKLQTIKTAIESASMLLRIDDVVSGLRNKDE
eukprot:229141_1